MATGRSLRENSRGLICGLVGLVIGVAGTLAYNHYTVSRSNSFYTVPVGFIGCEGDHDAIMETQGHKVPYLKVPVQLTNLSPRLVPVPQPQITGRYPRYDPSRPENSNLSPMGGFMFVSPDKYKQLYPNSFIDFSALTNAINDPIKK